MLVKFASNKDKIAPLLLHFALNLIQLFWMTGSKKNVDSDLKRVKTLQKLKSTVRFFFGGGGGGGGREVYFRKA